MKKIVLILILVLLLTGCAPAQVQDTPAEPLPTALAEPAMTPQPTPEPTPEPTPVPTPQPTPEPTLSPKQADILKYHGDDEFFFTDQREIVMRNPEEGLWWYCSPTLYVKVQRVFDEERTVTYYAAEVRTLPGETERSGFANPDKPGTSSKQLYRIQREFCSVIAINGDYMHRVEPEVKDIIIREEVVYSENGGADTLAFYPDGTLRVFSPGEVTAEQLLDDGVCNTYSFGPTLIKDGEIQPNLDKHRLSSANPRTALGMISPHHYLLVMVEGRHSGVSDGLRMSELAQLFADYGCTVAYNLDGGRSATMSFMGENVSRYRGDLTGQRGVPDALMYGYSPLLEKELESKE